MYTLILALCALPFFLYEKAPDFINDDVYYVDLADSLLHSHSYEANFARERVQPPGLSAILASICVTFGCTHDTLTRTMPVFLALGFLFSYEVIRRVRGRLIAAAACLIPAASPNVFLWVTSRLWPIFPYFFVTMVILLLVPKLEASKGRAQTLLTGVALCFLLIVALTLEGAGLALAVAILAWLFFSFFGSPGFAWLRLRRFLPIVLVALLAEGAWLMQGGNRRDWPLPGRGESYLAQLKLKSGNDPESGSASPEDLALRVEKNLRDSTVFLAETAFHQWVNPSWTSVVIGGLVILIFCGLWKSLRRSGSQLYALYFIFFQCIYLLWPWFSGVVRFAVAVLPFAVLYAAEGVLALWEWTREYARRLGAVLLPVTAALAVAAARENLRGQAHRGLQDKLSAVFWFVCTVVCVELIRKQRLTSWGRFSWMQGLFDKRCSVAGLVFRPVQLLVVLGTAYLVATGVAGEIPMGRENLVSGAAKFETMPEIQAARWIQSHTDTSAVIASRQVGLLYHYSRRKVIWFPPITKPEVLMQGLREHNVKYLVIVKRKFSYYLPPEAACLDLLSKAYPGAFLLVEDKPPLGIYEVIPDSAGASTNRAK